MKFRISWGGLSWTDEDVLAMDLISVQYVLGGDLENFDPWNGPAQLVAYIAALASRDTSRDIDDVLTEVRHAKASVLFAAIEPREEG